MTPDAFPLSSSAQPSTNTSHVPPFTLLLAAALVLALVPAVLCAQPTRLRGRVVDPSGAPMAGARIEIRDAAANATQTLVTADDGTFTATRRHADVVVYVEVPGFEPAAQSVGADDFAILLVTLEPGRRTETVIVQGEVPAGASPAVDRDEFARRNARRLGDVAKRLPGVYMTGPAGEPKDARVRGLDKEFTRVQVDGVQLPDGGEKRELQLSRLSSFIVGDVRLIRNATADVESDGIAGRLDVRTRTVPAAGSLEARVGLGLRGGSDRDLSQAGLAGGTRFGTRFGVFAAAERFGHVSGAPKGKWFSTGQRETEDEHDRQVAPTLYADLSVAHGPGSLHVRPLFFDVSHRKRRDKGVTVSGTVSQREAETETSSQTGRSLLLTADYAIGSRWFAQVSGGRQTATEMKDKVRLTYQGLDAHPAKTTTEPEDKGDRVWQASGRATVAMGGRVSQELGAGIALRTRDRWRAKARLEVGAAGTVADKTEARDSYLLAEDYAAAWVQHRVSVGPLSLTPGVRVEHVALETASPRGGQAASRFVDVNPSVHGAYGAGALRVTAAVSRGLNRPKFDELAPFEQESARTILVGNPDLAPARSWNTDLGASVRHRGATGGINVFHRSITGVIEQIDTGFDRNGRDILRVDNVGDGWVSGVEADQRLHVPASRIGGLGDLTIWANESLLGSELRASGGARRRFKEQPRWLMNAGLDFDRPASGTTLAVTVNAVGSRSELADNGQLKDKPSEAVLDVAFGQQLAARLRLFVELDNLTDRRLVERESLGGTVLTHRTERAGRTAFVGFDWRY